jgi:hypothetical protein
MIRTSGAGRGGWGKKKINREKREKAIDKVGITHTKKKSSARPG